MEEPLVFDLETDLVFFTGLDLGIISRFNNFYLHFTLEKAETLVTNFASLFGNVISFYCFYPCIVVELST